MEDRFFAALARAEDEAVKRFGQDPEGARDYLAGVTGAMAEEAMETALKIGRRIKGKYLCNTILEWI